jgi:hypothetical protein
MQMSLMVVVLLPKGGGDFRGIGLLDPCWKVVDKIMVRHMGAIEFSPLPPWGTSQVRDRHSNNRGKVGTTIGVGGAGTLISGLC